MLKKPLPDLKSWVNYFTQLELPVLQYTLDQIHQMQGQLDDVGIRDITQLIQHDPLLSLHLVRYLESRRHSAQITDVTTLDRVLLMIGIGGFFRAFGKSPTLETQLVNCYPGLQRCRRACARAFLAAKLAEAIAVRHYDIGPDEVVTATLLHNTAEILLWIAAPELASDIVQLQRAHPGMRSKTAQQQIIGITLSELQLELIRAWHLPQLLYRLIDDSHIDDPRVRIVAIATSLARHLDNSWNDAGLPDDYKDMANLIGSSPESAEALVKQIAIQAARSWHWFGTTPIAAGLALAAEQSQ